MAVAGPPDAADGRHGRRGCCGRAGCRPARASGIGTDAGRTRDAHSGSCKLGAAEFEYGESGSDFVAAYGRPEEAIGRAAGRTGEERSEGSDAESGPGPPESILAGGLPTVHET